MTQAFCNARVLTPQGFRDGLAVLVEAGRVSALVDDGDPRLGDADCVNLDGGHLVPGFIDAQVNGGGGVLFNDAPSVESLRTIAAAHRRFGTTALLPTLISDRVETMRAALAAVDTAIDAGVPGIVGIHLEGPYIAPARKGVHDAAQFRAPGADEMALLTAPHRGVVIVTLAPERVGAECVRELAAAGVIVAIGHSAGDYASTRGALQAGARGFTHLFNAMTPFGSREPGVVGAALDDRDSWCGIIADGHHVHPASLRVAIRAKAAGKMCLVTDAMPPVGASSPDFVLNGETIRAVDGICRTAEGTLAGSALDMAAAVRNAVRLVGVPLAEAARMASTYPAEFLGLDADRGRIAPGFRADFAVLDGELAAVATCIGGQFVRI